MSPFLRRELRRRSRSCPGARGPRLDETARGQRRGVAGRPPRRMRGLPRGRRGLRRAAGPAPGAPGCRAGTARPVGEDGRGDRGRRCPAAPGARGAASRAEPLPACPVAGLRRGGDRRRGGAPQRGHLLRPTRHDQGDGSPLPTPIAMTAGNVQIVTRGPDGVLELSTRSYDEVCPVGADPAGHRPSSDTTRLSALADLGNFDAFISPARDHILVMPKDPAAASCTWSRSSTGTKPTPSPAPATPTPTAPPTPPASPTPATASPSVSPDRRAARSRRRRRRPLQADRRPRHPSDARHHPPPPRRPPDASSPSPPPSVAVTPNPDGTLEIARDVILVGSISGYSADGTSSRSRPGHRTGPPVRTCTSGAPRSSRRGP